MILRGKVWRLGDNIDTDLIISGKHLSSIDPHFLAEHCFESLEKGWSKKISAGDIIVAGKNFGCGSSREHAPLAIKAAGISCIIAESFAGIFFRNAINLGLPVIELPSTANRFKEGDTAELNLEAGKIKNITSSKEYDFNPIPSIVLEILKAGGLLPYISKKAE